MSRPKIYNLLALLINLTFIIRIASKVTSDYKDVVVKDDIPFLMLIDKTVEDKIIISGISYKNIYQKNMPFSGKEKINEQVSASFFGFVGDNRTNNYSAFVKMAKFINEKKRNITVNFKKGTYKYKPLNYNDYEWRKAIELVDVDNIKIIGNNAIILQELESNWTTNGVEGRHMEEGPLQFRSSGNRTCKNIYITGLKMIGARVPYVKQDGACFGFSFRGVENIFLQNCHASGWGTDGLYLGSTYDNKYKSFNANISNCTFDNNTRQAVSVVGTDNCNFLNCKFTNTNGGSFGYGLDFEPNALQSQSKGSIKKCFFSNNEKGALNFIRTKSIEVAENVIIEKNESNSGAIYIDGGAANIPVDNIIIHNNSIETLKAALYINGSYWDNVKLTGNNIKTIGLPNNLATIRVNPGSNSTNLGSLYITNNKFKGTGGIFINGSAKGKAKAISNISFSNKIIITCNQHGLNNGDNIFLNSITGTVELNNRTFTIKNVTENTFELENESGENYTDYVSRGTVISFYNVNAYITDNTFDISQQNVPKGKDIFNIASNSFANLIFKRNKIRADNTVTPSNALRVFNIQTGEITDNSFASTDKAQFAFTDASGQSSNSLIISKNSFSKNFYYKGSTEELDIRSAGSPTIPKGKNRVLSGGYRRTTNGKNARIGDITYDTQNPKIKYICTASGSPGVWEKVID